MVDKVRAAQVERSWVQIKVTARFFNAKILLATLLTLFLRQSRVIVIETPVGDVVAVPLNNKTNKQKELVVSPNLKKVE